MGSGRNKRFEDSLLGRLEIANGVPDKTTARRNELRNHLFANSSIAFLLCLSSKLYEIIIAGSR